MQYKAKQKQNPKILMIKLGQPSGKKEQRPSLPFCRLFILYSIVFILYLSVRSTAVVGHFTMAFA